MADTPGNLGPSTRHLPGLDVLRSLAVLAVVGQHLLSVIIPLDAPRFVVAVLSWGNAGVDLFFVLSGYLISRIILAEVHKEGRLRIRRFWYRRWMRTLPAYYGVLAIIALSDWVIPPDRPWRNAWSYLIFLQNYANTLYALRFPWSWSLCVEEWFYLFLPLCLLGLCRILPRCSPECVLRIVAVVAFIVSAYTRHLVFLQFAAGLVDVEHGFWRVYHETNFRLDGLAVGVLLATVSLKPSRLLLAGSVLAGALLSFLVFAESLPGWVDFQRFGILALIFGSFVSVAVAYTHWRCWLIPGAHWVASLSYAIYLTHPILTKIVIKLLPGVSAYWRFAFFVVGTLGASLAVRHLLELPVLRIRDRRPVPALPPQYSRSELPLEGI